MRFTPHRVLVAVGTLALTTYLLASVLGLLQQEQQEDDAPRKQQIEAAFQHAWDGYSAHCFGHDSIHPVTNTCDDDFGGWGATAIDALSTAIIMRKEDVVLQILQFISTLDFTVVAGGTSVQLFEVTIRHFGGLISAWDLLTGPFDTLANDTALKQALYSQMVRLGDALSCGFKTPSGIPRNWVNPTLCKTDEGISNTLAGAGSLILEFARLSDITGNDTYVELARKSEEYLLHPTPPVGEPFPGILGSFVSVHDGILLDSKGSWGSLADSYYEYLVKAYMYDSRTYATYLDRWKVAADSTIRYIASHPYGRPEPTFLPYWEGTNLFNVMDSLSWFAGGNFILGGLVTDNQTLIDFGLSIANTSGEVYSSTVTGLGGEFVVWTETCDDHWGEDVCSKDNSVRLSTPSFKLRPEVIETWYYAYRATKDPKYKEWAWTTFRAIERVCRTSSGYSAISDVNIPDGGDKLDQQESFVFAEILKYIYLIHLEDAEAEYHIQDSRGGALNRWVFNTEAHPFRIPGDAV